jgi:hypothetical protein
LADGSALGLSLVRKKKGKRSEGGFGRGFIGWCCAAEREREGVRPAIDRRCCLHAPSGTLGRMAASTPVARRGVAGESQQGRRGQRAAYQGATWGGEERRRVGEQLEKRPVKRRGHGHETEQGEGLEVEEKGRSMIFQKYKDFTVKLR